MAHFKYKAKEANGNKIVQQIIEAPSYPDAYKTIINSGYLPMQISQMDEKSQENKIKKLKLRQVAIFCNQFSAMLSAGMTIVQCFDILRAQPQDSKNKILNVVYNIIYNDIQNGLTLFESMLSLEDTFPPVLVNMVRAGEASGNLDTVLERSAVYFDQQNVLMGKVKTSMIYPIVLLSVLLVVVVILFVFVLPNFFIIFEEMDIELPWITTAVMAVSQFFINYWYYIIIGIFLAIMAANILLSNPKIAYAFDAVKLRLPVFKVVIMKLSIARFSSTFSVLYSSGVSILESINISTAVITNKVFKDKLATVETQVEGGAFLSRAMREQALFEPMVISMVAVGEESGNLDTIMNNTADFYSNEAEQAIMRMVGLLEPLMIILLAILVGIIVAAVMLPTFSLSTGIADQIE